MEAWMHFEAMLTDVFQQPLAYPYPFGSANLGWLYEASDAVLRRLSYGRLRDQAVSVDAVFAEFKGEYMALWHTIQSQGMTPYLDSIGNCIFPIATVPITQRYVGRLSVARYRPMRGGRGGERSPFFLI